MNKLSDYLPFLIIVVSLIISVIGKKKKTETITQQTTLPGKTPVEPVVENKPQRTFTGSSRKAVEEKAKKPEIRNPEIKREQAVSSLSPALAVLESEEDGEPLFTFEDEDDVKKAIIYSEIINKRVY